MRLTSLVLHSDSTLEDIEFSLRGTAPKSRYTVRSILGIDAEDLIPKFYSVGAQSGAKYYEYTMKPREIVARIVLTPQYQINESVSDIRDKIYRAISATRSGELQLQFKSGPTIVAYLNGMITKMEVAHFAKVPELQITFMCPDPILRSLHPIEYAPSALPAANPVVLPDSASTAPHGLSFKVEFTALVLNFIIQDHATTPEWLFKVSPQGGFVSGDILHFSSEYKNKLVYLERTGDNRHLLDKVSADSVWPLIFPGRNAFYFLSIASFDWIELSYRSAYWGV